LLICIGFSSLACLGGVYFWAGSLSHARAQLRGDRVLVSPFTYQLGMAEEGTRRTASFRLTNLSDAPISILGAEAACGCTATQDLPLLVPPKATKVVRVEVTFFAHEGDFCRDLMFLTDSADTPRVEARICGFGLPGGNDSDEAGDSQGR
jgi:hypothetical protein